MRCCCVRTNYEEVRSSSTGDQVVSAVKESVIVLFVERLRL